MKLNNQRNTWKTYGVRIRLEQGMDIYVRVELILNNYLSTNLTVVKLTQFHLY